MIDLTDPSQVDDLRAATREACSRSASTGSRATAVTSSTSSATTLVQGVGAVGAEPLPGHLREGGDRRAAHCRRTGGSRRSSAPALSGHRRSCRESTSATSRDLRRPDHGAARRADGERQRRSGVGLRHRRLRERDSRPDTRALHALGAVRSGDADLRGRRPRHERHFWDFGKPTTDAFRAASILHYELVPTFLDLSRAATAGGLPITRPLGLHVSDRRGRMEHRARVHRRPVAARRSGHRPRHDAARLPAARAVDRPVHGPGISRAARRSRARRR